MFIRIVQISSLATTCTGQGKATQQCTQLTFAFAQANLCSHFGAMLNKVECLS